MHDTLIHIILHKKISCYILHTTTQYSILLYMKELHETKNLRSTIYSLVSTNYYIVNLSYEFYSWLSEMWSEHL